METGVAQLRVLIVADDRALVSTLQTYLTGLGIRAVVKAERGDTALQQVRGAKPPFDVVIGDSQMMGEVASNLVKAIRAEKNAVPFLMLTGRVDPGGVVLAKRHGANDCLAKPFNQHQLGDKLRAVTQTSRRPAA
jgi:two-component system, OmpR family, phosphate regulon response regulator OmpR